MNAKSIKKTIESSIPDVDIIAQCHDSGFIEITAISECHERLKLERLVSLALWETYGVEGGVNAATIKCYKTREELDLHNLRETIQAGLDSVLNDRWCGVDIDIRLHYGHLEVILNSPCLSGYDKSSVGYDVVQKALSDLPGTISANRFTVRVSNSFGPDYGLCEGHGMEDDDDDNDNPNWPSKTGNPSGGGRDNNPPRK